MWRPLRTKKSCAKISLLLLVVAITSCNTLKRVDDDELLIHRNTILVDSSKINDEDIETLILQKENSKVLGYPLRLNIYNLAKKNPDSSYQVWLHKKPDREKRLAKILSQKQTDRLGESFLVKGLSETLKSLGEPPAILDTSLTRRSLERLSAYYRSKGYFNNNTTYAIDSLPKKQRVGVEYQLTLGKPFMIDTVSHSIASSALDSIYQLNTRSSLVKKGNQIDLEDFNGERERLTDLFRNTGVYNFQESSIYFNFLGDTTKIANDQQISVELNIDDQKTRGEGDVTTKEYKVFSFDKINIYTDFLYDERDKEQEFIRHNGYTIFYRDKLRFKPETLTDAIFFEKDSIYRNIDRVRTYRRLNDLNVFRYPTITAVEDSTGQNLTANIYLSARPKYSFGFDLDVTHSSIQRIGLGVSPSLKTRNVFRGAENLSLSGRLNIGSSNDQNIADNRFFNIQEYGIDLTLDFPRIWFPFVNTNTLIPGYTLPRTRLSLGTTSQRNVGLDKQTFNSILGYNWTPSERTRHGIELINLQYVNNVRPEQFFRFYQSSYSRLNDIASKELYRNNTDLAQFYDAENNLEINNIPGIEPSLTGTQGFINSVLESDVPSSLDDRNEVSSIEERRQRLIENNLISATNYTFNLNNKTGITDNNYYQFLFKIESAGNILSAFSNALNFNEKDNKKEIVGVPFSQYVKTEFNYVKYWDLSRSNILAFRTFAGIAIPYGNSTNIPFVRSYFAGGPNDNRGWFPYSLGPGRTDALQDFNEANLKLALNLEYRFPIFGNFKGALFADAGNIWNVFDDVEDPNAKFNGISSLGDIALGSGFGVRYDFTYFVFRADIGFKTYNPAEEQSKRWFRTYNFKNSVLQIGINYPF